MELEEVNDWELEVQKNQFSGDYAHVVIRQRDKPGRFAACVIQNGKHSNAYCALEKRIDSGVEKDYLITSFYYDDVATTIIHIYTRPTRMCFHLEIKNNRLTVCATDGHAISGDTVFTTHASFMMDNGYPLVPSTIEQQDGFVLRTSAHSEDDYGTTMERNILVQTNWQSPALFYIRVTSTEAPEIPTDVSELRPTDAMGLPAKYRAVFDHNVEQTVTFFGSYNPDVYVVSISVVGVNSATARVIFSSAYRSSAGALGTDNTFIFTYKALSSEVEGVRFLFTLSTSAEDAIIQTPQSICTIQKEEIFIFPSPVGTARNPDIVAAGEDVQMTTTFSVADHCLLTDVTVFDLEVSYFEGSTPITNAYTSSEVTIENNTMRYDIISVVDTVYVAAYQLQLGSLNHPENGHYEWIADPMTGSPLSEAHIYTLPLISFPTGQLAHVHRASDFTLFLNTPDNTKRNFIKDVTIHQGGDPALSLKPTYTFDMNESLASITVQLKEGTVLQTKQDVIVDIDMQIRDAPGIDSDYRIHLVSKEIPEAQIRQTQLPTVISSLISSDLSIMEYRAVYGYSVNMVVTFGDGDSEYVVVSEIRTSTNPPHVFLASSDENWGVVQNQVTFKYTCNTMLPHDLIFVVSGPGNVTQGVSTSIASGTSFTANHILTFPQNVPRYSLIDGSSAITDTSLYEFPAVSVPASERAHLHVASDVMVTLTPALGSNQYTYVTAVTLRQGNGEGIDDIELQRSQGEIVISSGGIQLKDVVLVTAANVYVDIKMQTHVNHDPVVINPGGVALPSSQVYETNLPESFSLQTATALVGGGMVVVGHEVSMKVTFGGGDTDHVSLLNIFSEIEGVQYPVSTVQQNLPESGEINFNYTASTPNLHKLQFVVAGPPVGVQSPTVRDTKTFEFTIAASKILSFPAVATTVLYTYDASSSQYEPTNLVAEGDTVTLISDLGFEVPSGTAVGWSSDTNVVGVLHDGLDKGDVSVSFNELNTSSLRHLQYTLASVEKGTYQVKFTLYYGAVSQSYDLSVMNSSHVCHFPDDLQYNPTDGFIAVKDRVLDESIVLTLTDDGSSAFDSGFLDSFVRNIRIKNDISSEGVLIDAANWISDISNSTVSISDITITSTSPIFAVEMYIRSGYSQTIEKEAKDIIRVIKLPTSFKSITAHTKYNIPDGYQAVKDKVIDQVVTFESSNVDWEYVNVTRIDKTSEAGFFTSATALNNQYSIEFPYAHTGGDETLTFHLEGPGTTQILQANAHSILDSNVLAFPIADQLGRSPDKYVLGSSVVVTKSFTFDGVYGGIEHSLITATVTEPDGTDVEVNVFDIQATTNNPSFKYTIPDVKLGTYTASINMYYVNDSGLLSDTSSLHASTYDTYTDTPDIAAGIYTYPDTLRAPPADASFSSIVGGVPNDHIIIKDVANNLEFTLEGGESFEKEFIHQCTLTQDGVASVFPISESASTGKCTVNTADQKVTLHDVVLTTINGVNVTVDMRVNGYPPIDSPHKVPQPPLSISASEIREIRLPLSSSLESHSETGLPANFLAVVGEDVKVVVKLAGHLVNGESMVVDYNSTSIPVDENNNAVDYEHVNMSLSGDITGPELSLSDQYDYTFTYKAEDDTVKNFDLNITGPGGLASVFNSQIPTGQIYTFPHSLAVTKMKRTTQVGLGDKLRIECAFSELHSSLTFSANSIIINGIAGDVTLVSFANDTIVFEIDPIELRQYKAQLHIVIGTITRQYDIADSSITALAVSENVSRYIWSDGAYNGGTSNADSALSGHLHVQADLSTSTAFATPIWDCEVSNKGLQFENVGDYLIWRETTGKTFESLNYYQTSASYTHATVVQLWGTNTVSSDTKPSEGDWTFIGHFQIGENDDARGERTARYYSSSGPDDTSFSTPNWNTAFHAANPAIAPSSSSGEFLIWAVVVTDFLATATKSPIFGRISINASVASSLGETETKTLPETTSGVLTYGPTPILVGLSEIYEWPTFAVKSGGIMTYTPTDFELSLNGTVSGDLRITAVKLEQSGTADVNIESSKIALSGNTLTIGDLYLVTDTDVKLVVTMTLDTSNGYVYEHVARQSTGEAYIDIPAESIITVTFPTTVTLAGSKSGTSLPSGYYAVVDNAVDVSVTFTDGDEVNIKSVDSIAVASGTRSNLVLHSPTIPMDQRTTMFPYTYTEDVNFEFVVEFNGREHVIVYTPTENVLSFPTLAGKASSGVEGGNASVDVTYNSTYAADITSTPDWLQVSVVTLDQGEASNTSFVNTIGTPHASVLSFDIMGISISEYKGSYTFTLLGLFTQTQSNVVVLAVSDIYLFPTSLSLVGSPVYLLQQEKGGSFDIHIQGDNPDSMNSTKIKSSEESSNLVWETSPNVSRYIWSDGSATDSNLLGRLTLNPDNSLNAPPIWDTDANNRGVKLYDGDYLIWCEATVKTFESLNYYQTTSSYAHAALVQLWGTNTVSSDTKPTENGWTFIGHFQLGENDDARGSRIGRYYSSSGPDDTSFSTPSVSTPFNVLNPATAPSSSSGEFGIWAVVVTDLLGSAVASCVFGRISINDSVSESLEDTETSTLGATLSFAQVRPRRYPDILQGSGLSFTQSGYTATLTVDEDKLWTDYNVTTYVTFVYGGVSKMLELSMPPERIEPPNVRIASSPWGLDEEPYRKLPLSYLEVAVSGSEMPLTKEYQPMDIRYGSGTTITGTHGKVYWRQWGKWFNEISIVNDTERTRRYWYIRPGYNQPVTIKTGRPTSGRRESIDVWEIDYLDEVPTIDLVKSGTLSYFGDLPEYQALGYTPGHGKTFKNAFSPLYFVPIGSQNDFCPGGLEAGDPRRPLPFPDGSTRRVLGRMSYANRSQNNDDFNHTFHIGFGVIDSPTVWYEMAIYDPVSKTVLPTADQVTLTDHTKWYMVHQTFYNNTDTSYIDISYPGISGPWIPYDTYGFSSTLNNIALGASLFGDTYSGGHHWLVKRTPHDATTYMYDESAYSNATDARTRVRSWTTNEYTPALSTYTHNVPSGLTQNTYLADHEYNVIFLKWQHAATDGVIYSHDKDGETGDGSKSPYLESIYSEGNVYGINCNFGEWMNHITFSYSGTPQVNMIIYNDLTNIYCLLSIDGGATWQTDQQTRNGSIFIAGAHRMYRNDAFQVEHLWYASDSDTLLVGVEALKRFYNA